MIVVGDNVVTGDTDVVVDDECSCVLLVCGVVILLCT